MQFSTLALVLATGLLAACTTAAVLEAYPPTDPDMIVVSEAHRRLAGSARIGQVEATHCAGILEAAASKKEIERSMVEKAAALGATHIMQHTITMRGLGASCLHGITSRGVAYRLDSALKTDIFPDRPDRN